MLSTALTFEASDKRQWEASFSNLIGSVYRNGDVIFSPDGSSVISPVGNKHFSLVAAGGDDNIVRVVGSRDYRNLFIHPLAAHQGSIVACQFINNNYDLISVCKRGIANIWTASIQPGLWTKSEDIKSGDDTTTRLHYNKEKRISDMQINSVAINDTGDWLALGCGKGSAAQLVVWEWQSETYVLKQQAHSQRVLAVQYAPDGSSLATGAEDGKVKIWDGRTGFCTVTFDEHTSAVTGVCWTQNGKAILSSSLDGTVRAHDLKRYRNFRTLVCPEPTQLGAIAVDHSGDIVAGAAKEVSSIFIWSMENGSLLDVLTGHQSNIAGISMFGNTLASVSWDRTVKIWNVVQSTCETTELAQEGMAFIGSIDARPDLDPGRGQEDTITRQNAAQSKCFTCMQFSPDSSLLLLGGDSNTFCLYSVTDRILVKKFLITENRSLDGVVMDVNRRNFTEFGNMALCETSDSETEPNGKREIRLPGSKHMDLGERRRRFALCSTEGVGVYSLDTIGVFDPFQLDSQTTPDMIKE
ncbi:WD domain, G-beta repeat protein [Necator americanus]|uniref:WD domain, G-beta repeat protein n=1 Tax=Necator americanus TaxID=51031 RepID=W2SR72_NECAM|nr:WD domain, G-beta repeat protein [Necator americanus]ETN71197.1 WD domain, G-beta repeat protein [Necator americanus]